MNESRERATIEQPIATRDLYVRDADGRTHEVKVLVGAPERITGTEDYVCFYQIVGMGSGRIGKAYGADSAQALIHALQTVGVKLAAHQQHQDLKLWWLTEGDEELGFPLPLTSREPSDHHVEEPQPLGRRSGCSL
jgi:hypothetical protein